MATPKSLRLPFGTNRHGGAAVTADTNQGAESTEQLLRLMLLPHGGTAHPWLQQVGTQEALIFDNPTRMRVDVTARLREVFAVMEGRDRVRLLEETVQFLPDPANSGRFLVDFFWHDLRRGQTEHSRIPVGGNA